jgi:Holliday junction resolvase RusA-like endonuclease
MIYKITPVGKPRMTRSDRWKKRPATDKYWNFCDECRKHKVRLDPSGCRVTFFLPMPPSWSVKKRRLTRGMPHMGRPDLDNLLKSLLDALYQNDSIVWQLTGLEKYWEEEGKIVIEREIL